MSGSQETCSGPPADGHVPLWRLHLLRAMYLVLIAGLGSTIVPVILDHDPASRGVIPSLLGGVWLLAFLGLRYPLRMLPLLLFELAWKAVWMAFYGLPQYFSGQRPPTFGEDMFNIAFGGMLLIVIPWDHVWRRFVRQPAERWR